jgi:hypothetical protein
MTETQEEIKTTGPFVDVSIKLRPGIAEDFRTEVLEQHENSVKTVLKPKIGQPFWLKSMFDGRFDNNHYQITEETDWAEFKKQLKLGMVYVPVSFTDLIKPEP